MKLIPNRPPKQLAAHRIAIIGEAPGEDEEKFGEPFIGASGHILRNLLNNAGIHPDSVLLANVCNFRPPGNDISLYSPTCNEMLTSKARLQNDITNFDPHLCVLCGDTPMRLAGIEKGLSVTDMRGTLFRCLELGPLYGRKCLITYHPAAALRQWAYTPLIRLDFAKARSEGLRPDLELPNPTLDIYLSPAEILERFEAIRSNKTPFALDIEGNANNITCFAVATSVDYAFAVDISHMSPDDELIVMESFTSLCRDPSVPKILQQALYDNFCLSYRYGCLVRNVEWDTMVSGWEIYPELPKSLGVQASIWTRHPAYKHERTIHDWSVHLGYCCKDALVTYEIAQRHRAVLKGDSLTHFRLNMAMLPILLYMELRGTRFDAEAAKQFIGECEVKSKQIIDLIDQTYGKKLNPNSPKQVCDFLYKGLNMPPQFSKIGKGKKGGLTSDVNAILNLQKVRQDRVLAWILAYRKIDKQRQMASTPTSEDGRMRCAYNVVGTETGRLSAYTAADDTGTNLQTVTKSLRRLFLADEGYYYFQIDLAGADGWTVAAHCARFGDRTMLDDYLFGLKPAKIIVLLRKYGLEVNRWSRERIKDEGKVIGIGETEWEYFACKRVQHGTNYGLGPQTMSGQILADGYKYLGKTIIVPQTQCKMLQQLYASRYPGIGQWQSWVKKQLMDTQKLGCASGHTRRFFGRPNDIKTIQEAYAHEPQANTTFATSRAMQRLWNDPENRRDDGSIIIEPLHQVHDALNGQFPIELTEWAVSKLRSYLDNRITIAGQSILIPYDGAYAKSWGECDENYGVPVGRI